MHEPRCLHFDWCMLIKSKPYAIGYGALVGGYMQSSSRECYVSSINMAMLLIIFIKHTQPIRFISNKHSKAFQKNGYINHGWYTSSNTSSCSFYSCAFLSKHGVGRKCCHSPLSTKTTSHSHSQQSKFLLFFPLAYFILQLTVNNLFLLFSI